MDKLKIKIHFYDSKTNHIKYKSIIFGTLQNMKTLQPNYNNLGPITDVNLWFSTRGPGPTNFQCLKYIKSRNVFVI